MNGNLRVAYRASREGSPDIVFVFPSSQTVRSFRSCRPLQGWVEAMTSLGRLIFFDQPGTGASDPVTPGALPTLEQWADSITAVLDDLGSSEAVLLAVDGAFATAALFAATHPSRTTALVVLEGFADPGGHRWARHRGSHRCHARHVGHGGVAACRSIRTCRGTKRSGRRGRGMTAWRRAQGPLRSCCLDVRIGRAGGASDNPRANSGRPSR